MAQGDNPPGLLSKVAKLVRNPNRDGADSQQPGFDPDNGYNKQALKAMIERKRQNDAVRKREFDHLRKLRRADANGSPDQGGRPSFFHSSLNHDERAETLKKIDEIEAQMSRQWWKGRPDSPATTPDLFPPTAPVSVAVPNSPEQSLSGRSTKAPPLAQSLSLHPPRADTPTASEDLLSLRFPLDLADTQPMRLDSANSSKNFPADSNFPSTQVSDSLVNAVGQDDIPTDAATRPTEAPSTQTLSQFDVVHEGEPDSSIGWKSTRYPLTVRGVEGAGFSSRRLFSVAGTDTQTDPDLEDVAIRFANGDDAGAEQGLLMALQANNPPAALANIWIAALFDLYRATGQQAKFERAALDFASRFGRSAPVWFSTPELLGRVAGAPLHPSSPMPTKAAVSLPTWTCPALVTLQDLDNLQALIRAAAGARVLINWQLISEIEPEALATMSEVFTYWCETPLNMVFRGHESLERVLKQITPSADSNMPAAGWKLRMDAMRLLLKIDEFELVALEYCVTYEVSPPSWQGPKSSCVIDGAADRTTQDAGPVSIWAESRLTAGAALDGLVSDADQSAQTVELSGEILGDAIDALTRLDGAMDNNRCLVVDCSRLIRVDFTAAGGILNWVAEHQAQGCEIQFKEINHLVAAFFRVIGIHEHALVQVRSA